MQLHQLHNKGQRQPFMNNPALLMEYSKTLQDSNLIEHKKRLAHLKRQKSLNTNLISNHTNYFDCGEDIKVEDIKEEVKEEVHNDYVEIKEEVSMDDPLSSLE